MSTPLKYLILTHFKLADNFCPFFKKLQKSKNDEKFSKIRQKPPKSTKNRTFLTDFQPKIGQFSGQIWPEPPKTSL